ncbi:MAG TPA: DUF885 family protein [Calditrichia bacterium]|nr:DUF885 family protein [Calditrichia bacterium]HQV32314.1 DUF885 family protein [Calditrichia bacterium]
MRRKIFTLSLLFFSLFATSLLAQSANYQDLVALFREWRQFEKPPLREGAPDYTAATFEKRYQAFQRFQERLNAIDYRSWPVTQQVDWQLLQAELNGFDFNHRILKPWVRDPAFYKSVWTYQSDVPAHEGPTHHMTTELWTYAFPLTKSEEKRLIGDLGVIPPLNRQARQNLTGNARELWIAGIRDIRQQIEDLDQLRETVGSKASKKLQTAIAEARQSTETLAAWLEAQGANKTGPSGIGKENYTWYQQNVHLVPLTWDEEVTILKRELARAWSSLKLEEHRNRDLPPIRPAATEAEYDALAKSAAQNFLTFLKEKEIVTVADYFEPTLNEHLMSFVPPEKRNFFVITAHHDPRPLFSHFYHWFVLARMAHEPHPSIFRKDALLYNIFDSRDEGLATALEELLLQAGLYDQTPRAREIVYIMIAQRAARGLGSLYAQANEISMEEAGKVHSEWTPRGWMKTEPTLLLFEQHLYMRQPGYGTSYITGKYLLEEVIATYAHRKEQQGQLFVLKEFMDELNAVGSIPASLVGWEMTGSDALVKGILK